jgi:hypothetical protein
MQKERAMGQYRDRDGRNAQELTFMEKGSRLLNHWIHHNDDHIGSYEQWAAEFRGNQLEAVAVLLEAAAELTKQINQTLGEAIRLLPSPKEQRPD